MEKVSVLKIDKDCIVEPDWIQDYVRTATTICQLMDVKVVRIRMCPSRSKGLHFYIDIKPMVSLEFANRLQWLLGDDCRRVDFNRARIESSLPEPIKLFEEPSVRLRTIYDSRRCAT